MTELALRVLYMGLMAAVVTGIVLPLRWGAKRLRLPAGLCVVPAAAGFLAVVCLR